MQKHVIHLDGVEWTVNKNGNVYEFIEHPFGKKGLDINQKQVEVEIEGCRVSFNLENEDLQISVFENGNTFPKFKSVCQTLMCKYNSNGWTDIINSKTV